MSNVKISYNHSTNLFTLYTEFGNVQFGGYSELQSLLTRDNFKWLNSYALNKTFLRAVARKHHGGRGAQRVFIVPLKSEVASKHFSYMKNKKEKNGEVDRAVLYAEDIACCKHNMDVAVCKAREKKDLSYFSLYFNAYKDFFYFSTGRTYVSKKMEADAYKRFLNLVS